MKKIWKILIYAVLGIQAVVTIYPLIWMILASLKDNISFLADPWSLPKELRFFNYQVAWEEGIQDFMLNSIMITAATVLIVILLSCTFSFMLARFPFKGSGILIGLFFAGMMIPVHCTLIPLYNIMNTLGLVDKLWALLFPYVASSLPLAIFLTYGHYQQLPDELEEAARIDGCNVPNMFFRIFLPLAKPIISTVSILTALNAWNEFIFANVLITDPAKKTLPVGLMALKGTYSTDYAAMSAALTMSAIPIILLYILMSNKIQSGMVAGAVKS
nr:carbohydrate ABC transporter permease [uncultured Sellimonas sp.]